MFKKAKLKKDQQKAQRTLFDCFQIITLQETNEVELDSENEPSSSESDLENE